MIFTDSQDNTGLYGTDVPTDNVLWIPWISDWQVRKFQLHAEHSGQHVRCHQPRINNVNKLEPIPNGCNAADDIFKFILWMTVVVIRFTCHWSLTFGV